MPSQSINSFSATMASTSELQVQEQKAASNEIKQQVQEVQIFQIQCLQVIKKLLPNKKANYNF